MSHIVAKESGHYYTEEGKPFYTIVGKNGKERNTNLRDAKKLNLYPSVTTIMQIMAKPGLEIWKQNQILQAALTLPKIDGEQLDDFAKRVIADSREQANLAREKGTDIHGALENYFLTGKIKKGYEPVIMAVQNKLTSMFGEQEWLAEKSFSHIIGYAGKIDLHSREIVIDYKCKEFSDDKLPCCYDENFMQGAAYTRGVGVNRFANVFVSTNEEGLVHVVEHTRDQLSRGWEMFKACLRLWKAAKKYYPGETK